MKSTLAMGLFAAALGAGTGAQAQSVQLALCPASTLHAYPLAPGARFESLVVPNLAVANRSGASVEVKALTFELLDKGQVIDTRRLAGESLAGAVKAGAAAQPQIGLFGFQFCDGRLLGEKPVLSATATLRAGEQALVTNQTFGWKGSRDRLRVTATLAAAAPVSIETAIDAATAKTSLKFPLAGRWFVAVAGTPHGGHRWALPEAFAYDIAALGADNKTFRGEGRAFADYYAYGAPVLAAGDGVVAEVVGDQPENPSILRRPGESLDAYGGRVGALQMALIERGERAIGGNSVLIDHGNGEYSFYAHLKPGSLKVKPGQGVMAGDPIGALGASGNATEPHLHFQVCDGPSALHCAGVPLSFSNIELPFADGPRAIQAGDIVVTTR